MAGGTELSHEMRFGQKLTEEQQHQVMVWFAQFHQTAEVRKRIKDEWGIDLAFETLRKYQISKKWRPLIDRLRQEWAAGIMDLPLAHKRGRVEELSKHYDDLDNLQGLSLTRKLQLRLSILDQIRTEMAEAKTHFTTIFATQITNYSDDELMKRRDEVLSHLKSLTPHMRRAASLSRVVNVEQEVTDGLREQVTPSGDGPGSPDEAQSDPQPGNGDGPGSGTLDAEAPHVEDADARPSSTPGNDGGVSDASHTQG